MTTSYYLLNQNADIAGGLDFSFKLSQVAGALASQSFSIAASTSETSVGYTDASHPGPRDVTLLNFSVKVNVTTANTNIQISIVVSRVNSLGATQQSSAQTAEQQATAGVKTFTLNSVTLGPFASTDRFRVNYILRNTNSMSAQSVGLGFNDADTEVVTPWDLAPTLLSVTANDSGRDWTNETQDLVCVFSEPVNVAAGVSKIATTLDGFSIEDQLTYVSGSGTDTLIMRAPRLYRAGTARPVLYQQAYTGNAITSVATGFEAINAFLSITNNLTKRVRGFLKKSDGTAAASETINLTVLESSVPGDGTHMSMVQDAADVTTDASGFFDEAYVGAAAPGSPVMVAIQRDDATPDEYVLYPGEVE